MKTKLEDIQIVYDMLNKSKVEQKGYILLPDMEGFKLFEIDEERLKMYLQMENYHRKAIKL